MIQVHLKFLLSITPIPEPDAAIDQYNLPADSGTSEQIPGDTINPVIPPSDPISGTLNLDSEAVKKGFTININGSSLDEGDFFRL